MITKMGVVASLLGIVAILLLFGVIPVSEPLRSALFAVVLTVWGTLLLFRTHDVISPLFATSRYSIWVLRLLGLFFLIFGAATAVRLVGNALGVW